MDPPLNAAAADPAEETACGFAVDLGQEAHGSCLKKTSELQQTFTIFMLILYKTDVPYFKEAHGTNIGFWVNVPLTLSYFV